MAIQRENEAIPTPSTETRPSAAAAFPAGPWVAIVANPFSGAKSNRQIVGQLAAAIEKQGLACRVIWGRAERGAVLHHPELAGGCRCVIAAGGDGTIADVINERPEIPLAVLPLGTENLFAKQFGFMGGSEAIARAVAAGKHRPIDVGEVTGGGSEGLNDPRIGRRFSLMLSLGADAEVVRRLAVWRAAHPEKLRRVRQWSYTRHILATLTRYPYPSFELHADGNPISGTHAFIFNLPRYGLGLTFAPEASDDDGLLNWIVFKRPGTPAALNYIWAVIRQKHYHHADVAHGRARQIQIHSTLPVPVQMDGEAIGFTPVSLEVKPRALRVVVT